MIRLCLLLSFAAPLFAAAQAGTLDPTFGDAGLVQSTIDANSNATGVAVQADGRIVCAVNAAGHGIVARYLGNGDPDTGFGTDGLVQLDLESPELTRVLMQPDGGILVCGDVGLNSFVARLLPDGTMDGGFGTDGIVQVDSEGANDFTWDMALRPDGRILVLSTHALDGVQSIQLTGLEDDGSLDATFAGSGIFRLAPPSGTGYYPSCLALQSDGKAVVGSGWDTPLHYRIVLRWNVDGTLDDTFGDGGIANLTDIGAGGIDQVTDLLIDASDRIHVAGTRITPSTEQKLVYVTRLTGDGSIDTDYGTNGHTASLDVGWQLFGMQGCLQDDGRLVMGSIHYGPGNQFHSEVHRFTAEGQLDPAFGLNGLLSAPIPASTSTQMAGLALQPDGKAVVCGRLDHQVALARILLEGPNAIDEHATSGLHVALLPDGRHRITCDGADLGRCLLHVRDVSGRVLPATLERSGSSVLLDLRHAPAGGCLVEAIDGTRRRTVRLVNMPSSTH